MNEEDQFCKECIKHNLLVDITKKPQKCPGCDSPITQKNPWIPGEQMCSKCYYYLEDLPGVIPQ